MRKLTTEEWIVNAERVHGDYFDHSRVNYINCKTKVEIGCPIHGWFWMTPVIHLAGTGCRMHGKMKRVAWRKITTTMFKKEATAAHGDLFDYSESNYIDSVTKLQIGCPIHGFFWTRPNNHIVEERGGCSACVQDKRSKANTDTTEIYIVKAKIRHDDYFDHAAYFDYSRVDYKGSKENVEIGCPVHGWFWQEAGRHLEGRACQKCGWEKSSRPYTNALTILYYIKLTDLDGTVYWKVGITVQTLKKRFRLKVMEHVDVLLTKQYDTGFDAYKMEQYILNRFQAHRVYNKEVSIIKTGWTELFNKNVLEGYL